MHLVQLRTGYPWAPGWLAAYFYSLTVLDPLAAVLLLRGRRVGLPLAAGILITDAAANAYACYVLDEGGVAARVGQGVITVLALVAVGATFVGGRAVAPADTGRCAPCRLSVQSRLLRCAPPTERRSAPPFTPALRPAMRTARRHHRSWS